METISPSKISKRFVTGRICIQPPCGQIFESSNLNICERLLDRDNQCSSGRLNRSQKAAVVEGRWTVPAGSPTQATRLTSPPDSPEPQEPPAQAQATQVSAECQPESERERGSERRKNKKSTLSERLDLCPERLSWVCFWIYLQETVHCPMHVNLSVQRPKHLSLMPMWSSLLYIAPAMSDCRSLFVKFLSGCQTLLVKKCWIDVEQTSLPTFHLYVTHLCFQFQQGHACEVLVSFYLVANVYLHPVTRLDANILQPNQSPRNLVLTNYLPVFALTFYVTITCTTYFQF